MQRLFFLLTWHPYVIEQRSCAILIAMGMKISNSERV
jgi:hypothetical protein